MGMQTNSHVIIYQRSINAFKHNIWVLSRLSTFIKTEATNPQAQGESLT